MPRRTYRNLFKDEMKKKVFYYTSAYFMDVSVEMIHVLKKHADLYVFIEITDASKAFTILNIQKLPEGRTLIPAHELLDAQTWSRFRSYFENTKAVYFVVHNYPASNLFRAYHVSAPVKKMIRSVKPDILHFEGFTLRSMGMIPAFTKVKKLLFAVHDSQVHSGMKNLKISVPRMAMFRWPFKKWFLFYSKYCEADFRKNVKHSSANYLNLYLYPYSFYRNLASSKPEGEEYILFFGRISEYKGLDLLLDAMPAVWEQFPSEKLVIAGGGASAGLLEHPLLKNKDERIVFFNRFIPTDELTGIIKLAKFVVCPYRDATQSGVLHTSFAMNKPVLATNVGAFSEQVHDNINGKIISAVTTKDIAGGIIESLKNNQYQGWAKKIKSMNEVNQWEKNADLLASVYE